MAFLISELKWFHCFASFFFFFWPSLKKHLLTFTLCPNFCILLILFLLAKFYTLSTSNLRAHWWWWLLPGLSFLQTSSLPKPNKKEIRQKWQVEVISIYRNNGMSYITCQKYKKRCRSIRLLTAWSGDMCQGMSCLLRPWDKYKTWESAVKTFIVIWQYFNTSWI